MNALDLPNDAPWMTDALCAQVGLEAFYPGTGESYRPGRRVCDQCPVTAQCLDYALANHAEIGEYGMWGGTTPSERLRILGLDQAQAAA